MNSLKVLMNHFREQSFEILYAKNGEEACKIVNEELPNLILMDCAEWYPSHFETKGKAKNCGYSDCDDHRCHDNRGRP